MTRQTSLAEAKAHARALANEYGMGTAAKNQDGHMAALAFSLRDMNAKVMSLSGPIERVTSPERPFGAYLREFRDFLPWNGLTPVANRPFEVCAEAHLWLELTARGKKPRDYYEASFTKRGDLSAPCANCEQWVFNVFGHVFTPTLHYAGHPKQRP